MHPQALGGLGGVDADAAAAQQAVGLARQLHQGIIPVAPVLAALPLALVDRPVMVADVEAGLQQQGDGELADGVAAVVGHVAHGDALLPGVSNVHHVEAGSRHGDHFQVGAAVQDPAGHRGLVDDGDLRAADPADHLVLVVQADPLIEGHVSQGLQGLPAEVAGIFRVAVCHNDVHKAFSF